MKKEKITPAQDDEEVISAQQAKIKRLEFENQKLRTDNTKMMIILQDNSLLEKINDITDEEAICIEQIRKLRDRSAKSEFTEQDSRIFDILHKNLKIARGEKVAQDKSSKTKKMDNKELLTLLKSEDLQ
jgi:nitrous oxide reductase